jgi:hypothetical protein
VLSTARGQSGGPYVLESITIDSGGQSFSATAPYELGVTIGQPEAFLSATNPYEFRGGFWNTAGACECRLFGDLVEPFCKVDLADILRSLDAFSAEFPPPEADVFPCGGDIVVDVQDILAVIDAFSDDFQCEHPCAP